jgi:hypothetical protein
MEKTPDVVLIGQPEQRQQVTPPIVGRTSSGFGSSDWVPFEGTLRRFVDFYVLYPYLDSRIEITINNNDVMESSAGIFVRVGGHWLSIEIPPASVLHTRVFAGTANSELCNTKTTMCVGGVEWCCEDGTIVGACVGYWRCPL